LKCKALVITCLDYRIQEMIIEWLGANVGHGSYNRVALAGGVKNWPVISEQIDLSKRMQDIEQVIIIHHEDCRAYGPAGTFERHCGDMRQARAEILKKYPDLRVDLYYARLNGDHGGELVEVK
jgi:carbonic anhydrase